MEVILRWWKADNEKLYTVKQRLAPYSPELNSTSIRITKETCPTCVEIKKLGPVVQSIVSLTSSLRVISLTVLVDSIHNILKFFEISRAMGPFFML